MSTTSAQLPSTPAGQIDAATAIGPVALTVSALDRSRAFYERTIGLRATELGDGTLALGVAGEAPLIELRGDTAAPRLNRRATGLYHLAAYSAAKHAVVGLIRGTAMDLAQYGITANAVSPGSTRTALLDASARVYGLESPEAFAPQQPIGRLIEPIEVAASIAWLCSPSASAITGADVAVADGSENSKRRLERVLTSDPGMGVLRHADAGYSKAVEFAATHKIDIPMKPKARN